MENKELARDAFKRLTKGMTEAQVFEFLTNPENGWYESWPPSWNGSTYSHPNYQGTALYVWEYQRKMMAKLGF
jgi:hypothetical protein